MQRTLYFCRAVLVLFLFPETFKVHIVIIPLRVKGRQSAQNQVVTQWWAAIAGGPKF